MSSIILLTISSFSKKLSKTHTRKGSECRVMFSLLKFALFIQWLRNFSFTSSDKKHGLSLAAVNLGALVFSDDTHFERVDGGEVITKVSLSFSGSESSSLEAV